MEEILVWTPFKCPNCKKKADWKNDNTPRALPVLFEEYLPKLR